MIGRYISRGIPKCYNCIYYRSVQNMEHCIKFFNKEIKIEIVRNNDFMCGYNGTHHTSGELLVIKDKLNNK